MPAYFRGYHGRDCGHGTISAMRDAYLQTHKPHTAYMNYHFKTPIRKLMDPWEQSKLLKKADFDAIFANPEFHGNFADFGIYMNLESSFDARWAVLS